MATVVEVYEQCLHVKIPLDIIAFGPLADAMWTKAFRNPLYTLRGTAVLLPFRLSRAQAFSCIAMFESAVLNLDPASLMSAFAISANDSIYVAAPLLCDPSVRCDDHRIQRIAGNVGSAGLALLIPPTDPKIKRLGVEAYHLINHSSFDGKIEDNFRNTSLHLGFTGYALPIDVGTHGSRSREAFFLESVVSVHDRGEWVADLDILALLSTGKYLKDSTQMQ